MKRLLLLGLLAAQTAVAQTYSDQGLMGASGIVLFPTATISPKAQFRLHGGRMSFLGKGLSGVNVIGLSGGLSSNVEAYLRLAEDQSAGSLTSYGFGLKFLVPFSMPVVDQVSLWGESVRAEAPAAGQLYPANLVRTGMAVLLSRNGVRPQIFLGVSFQNSHSTTLAGAGVTLALGRRVQLGAEVLSGYAGSRTTHMMGSGAVRVLSGVCVQIGMGYLAMPRTGTALMSVGFSVGSADIDFAPVVEEKRREFKMPTIEEMEQQSGEEEKK
jgi:hypothetical protein